MAIIEKCLNPQKNVKPHVNFDGMVISPHIGDICGRGGTCLAMYSWGMHQFSKSSWDVYHPCKTKLITHIYIIQGV